MEPFVHIIHSVIRIVQTVEQLIPCERVVFTAFLPLTLHYNVHLSFQHESTIVHAIIITTVSTLMLPRLFGMIKYL